MNATVYLSLCCLLTVYFIWKLNVAKASQHPLHMDLLSQNNSMLLHAMVLLNM